MAEITKGTDRLRIAIFSKIPMFPSHAGGRTRILRLCEILMELGCDITFFLIPSRQMRDFDRSAHETFLGADRFHVFERGLVPTALFGATALFHVLRRRLMPNASPVDDPDYLYPRTFDTQARAATRDAGFDAVIVEYVHFTRILDQVPHATFTILDTMDSFSHELTPAAETKGFRRAHKILAIQEDEATLFRHQLGKDADRVMIQSHMLNIETPLSLEQTEGAAFLGSSFEANQVSLRYFLDKVMPLVLQQVPTFKLHLAGSICSDVDDGPGIVKLGRVSTVSDAFRAAPILINPIRAGTGVKIKLLEALALGVPSVTTTSGLRGVRDEFCRGTIEVGDDDAAGFATQLLRLFSDRDLRTRLGREAHAAARLWNDEQRHQLMLLLDEVRTFREEGDPTNLRRAGGLQAGQ